MVYSTQKCNLIKTNNLNVTNYRTFVEGSSVSNNLSFYLGNTCFNKINKHFSKHLCHNNALYNTAEFLRILKNLSLRRILLHCCNNWLLSVCFKCWLFLNCLIIYIIFAFFCLVLLILSPDCSSTEASPVWQLT